MCHCNHNHYTMAVLCLSSHYNDCVYSVYVQDVCCGLDESIRREMRCSLMLKQSNETLDMLQKDVFILSDAKGQKSNSLKVRIHMNTKCTQYTQ